MSGTGRHATDGRCLYAEKGFAPGNGGYLAGVAEEEIPGEPTESTKELLARGEELLARAREALTQMDELLARPAPGADPPASTTS